MRQLQLDIEPQLDARISDFSGPGWGHVIDAIRQLHAGLINRFYVYGGAGTGKSHLLSGKPPTAAPAASGGMNG